MIGEPLISIIIPVYNTEQYLRQCLDSVINQSYHNLQVIIVDDGSPDGSPRICDEYMRDSRVIVIHKENGGLSDARNVGLDAALGDYIGFLDSDDWIDYDFYEVLLRTSLEQEADISCCGFKWVGEGEEQIILFNPGKCMTPADEIADTLYYNNLNVVVWNKLYVARLFENVRFPKGEIHEDEAVYCKIVGSADRIAHVDYSGYNYRKRQSSIVANVYSPRRREIVLKNIERKRAYISKHFPELLSVLDYYDAQVAGDLLINYLDSGGMMSGTEYVHLITECRKKMYFIMKHHGLPVKHKLKILLAAIGVYTKVKRASSNKK